MQKRVLEVLKTWYFPYSAFGLQANGGGYSPPRPPPPGYATASTASASAFTFLLETLNVRLHRRQSNNAKQHETLSNTKQPKFDVIDSSRNVATGRKLLKRFLNLAQ